MGPYDALDELLAEVDWRSVLELRLLYDLARQLERGCIVEVGSAQGQSTVALALGSCAGGGRPVFAIEPHEHFRGVLGGVFTPGNRAKFFRNMLRCEVSEIVRLINLSSEIVAPGWNLEVGLLFIDGDHRYPSVSRDFECWYPHLLPDGLVVFHDSLDETIGPRRVIAEALERRLVERVNVVGRSTVLRKRTAAGGA